MVRLLIALGLFSSVCAGSGCGGAGGKLARDGSGGVDEGPTEGLTEPPLDGCGIVRRLPLGSVDLALRDDLRISRVGEGFLLSAGAAAGDLVPSVSFINVSANGTRTAVTTATVSSQIYGVGAAANGTRAGGQLLVFSSGGRDATTQLVEMVAMALDLGATAFRPARTLFSTSFINQNVEVGAVPSLDGQRSIFTIGSPIVSEPRLGLVGGDGVPIGLSRVITTTPSRLWTNLQAVPTMRGGAVSVMDREGGSPRWHLVELDGTGAAVFDATIRLPNGIATDAVAHVVSPSQRGFAAVFRSATSEAQTLFEVERPASPSGPPATARLNQLPLGGAAIALAPMGTDFLVARASTDVTTLSLARVKIDGSARMVTVQLPGAQSAPTWIPAEADALYFVYRTAGGREIVQVTCHS